MAGAVGAPGAAASTPSAVPAVPAVPAVLALLGTVPNPKYAQLQHSAIAAVSLVLIVLIAKFARGFIANISVQLGIVIAAVIATVLGCMNFNKVGKAPGVDLVLPFEIATAVFDPILILTTTLVMNLVMIESTGMLLARSDFT